jgi:hypothetical protein
MPRRAWQVVASLSTFSGEILTTFAERISPYGGKLAIEHPARISVPCGTPRARAIQRLCYELGLFAGDFVAG